VVSINPRLHFDYIAPKNLEVALIELRHNPGAVVIAGGTDVIPRWRNGLLETDLLIDLKLLKLSYISIEANQVRIGACTTFSQLLTSAMLSEHFPVLVEACRQIAAPPIRNRGTLGGNLVNASPAADAAPPLLAYDAELVLAKPGSIRNVPVEEFFIGPGMAVKKPDEILTEIRIPLAHSKTTSAFLKLGKRQAMAIAVASVAVRISLSNAGEATKARIALGSVAPTPLRARKAELFLEGKQPRDEVIHAAAQLAQGEASPISDIRASKEYRSRMVEVLVRRALYTVRRGLSRSAPDG
jgi:CO/xanthine dehydrogenase FAD-binding subunit